jgi:hypothetical protein
MRYLIDGYNLLHAMGVLAGRTGPGGLEKARLRLLGLLSSAHGKDASDITVVFDAAAAPRDAPTEQVYQGLHVRFAHRQEADDVIEDLIRHDAAPRQLAVVSDDHRIQQAARRRRCLAVKCGDYLDELDRRRRRPATSTEEPAKPDRVPRGETERWLDEFADLDRDPRLRELFAPPEFFAEEE